MKKFILIFIFAHASLIVIACETSETVHTIDWYKTHHKEREQKIKECENNPGELSGTPNCVNANRAKPIKRDTGLNLKPITEEEWEMLRKKYEKPRQ